MNIRLITGIFILLHMSYAGWCQSHSGNEILINNTVNEVDIKFSIGTLQEPETSRNIPLILSGKSDTKFLRRDNDIPGFGLDKKSIWHKFILRADDTLNKKWFLIADHASVDSMDLFYRDSLGSIQSLHASRANLYKDKKYKFNSVLLDLPSISNSGTNFYARIVGQVYSYPLKIVSHERFVSLSLERNIIQGLFIGFFIMMLFYNLFIFFMERDKSFLLYVIYVFVNGLTIAVHKGYLGSFLQDHHQAVVNYLPDIMSLNILSLILFSGNILEISNRFSLVGKIIHYVFVPLAVLFLVIQQFTEQGFLIIANLAVLFILIAFLSISAFRIYRNNFRPAAFYFFGSLCVFIGLLIYMASLFGVLPNTGISPYAIELGAAAQIMLYSFALGDKIREYKKLKSEMELELLKSLKDNEQIILEQNRMLEVSASERSKELTLQKEQSDKLLLNILPEEVATELKSKGNYEAKLHPNVSVLFSDFVNFTRISEKLSPKELVAKLDQHFRAFDNIIEENGLEKIRTIGDAYLAVCGLQEDQDHAKRTVKAAIEIRDYINHQKESGDFFDVRLGVHTGSVVAGIVGDKKFTYDIWGETVNLASKLEQVSDIGKVNISSTTQSLLNNEFEFDYKGKVSTKADTELDYYFVEYA